METIGIFPITFDKDNEIINSNIIDEDEYKNISLKWAVDNNLKKYVLSFNNDFNPIKLEFEYKNNDFTSFIIQYKLKKYKLICFNALFDYNLLPNLNNRFNPNKTLLMLDHAGFDVICTKNLYFGKIDKKSIAYIPEIIHYDRFIYHSINDFFEIDFSCLKNHKYKNNSDFININLKLWFEIFNGKMYYYKNYDKLINNFIDKLIDKKLDLAIKQFDKLINKKISYL